MLGWIDMLFHESGDAFLQVLDLVGISKIHCCPRLSGFTHYAKRSASGLTLSAWKRAVMRELSVHAVFHF
jgi:hypothetical protein